MTLKEMNRDEWDSLEADEVSTKIICIALVMAIGVVAAIWYRLL